MIFLTRPFVGEDEVQAVRKVIESKYLTEGPVTIEFEKKFAEYVGVKYGVATTSCTSGMEVCLRAVGVGPGDEVIVPDFTFPASALAVMGLGAKPVLVDVGPPYFTIDLQRVVERVTKKTRAILCVSNLGFPIEYEPLIEFGRQRGISVIEDAACSTGTMVRGRKLGSMVDASVFSFHARKVMTTGEGGMICTDNGELATRCHEIKNFGATKGEIGRQNFERWGTNLKLPNILAAIGMVQLEKLEMIINARTKCARVYDRLLEGKSGIELIRLPDYVRYNYYCYPLLVDRRLRDQTIKLLRERNIEAQILSYALHRQPFFQSLLDTNSNPDATFAGTTRIFECGMQLPLHQELTEQQQRHVCETLLDVLRGI